MVFAHEARARLASPALKAALRLVASAAERFGADIPLVREKRKFGDRPQRSIRKWNIASRRIFTRDANLR